MTFECTVRVYRSDLDGISCARLLALLRRDRMHPDNSISATKFVENSVQQAFYRQTIFSVFDILGREHETYLKGCTENCACPHPSRKQLIGICPNALEQVATRKNHS